MAELEITKDEALAAVRAAAGPNGQVSTLLSAVTGEDTPLENVEEEIRVSRRVFWADPDGFPAAFGHHLAVTTAEGIHFYEVKRPPEVSDGAA